MSDFVPQRPDLPPQNHPERKNGEILLCNCPSDEPDIFADISYQTKRAGLVAHDATGAVVTHMFPVFIWEMDYDRNHREVKIGH